MPGRKWTEDELRYLSEHWPTEGSKKVAAVLNRTARAVMQKAGQVGLVCDQAARIVRRGMTLQLNNTRCDIHYFARPWTPTTAYIVGYIFADGSISNNLCEVGFLCHTKDEEIILAIRDELKSTSTIHRKPGVWEGDSYNGPRTSFDVGSKILVRDLMDRFGLRPRKTYLDLSMPQVPDILFGHFLRGYFDGDGHIGKRKVCNGGEFSFVGTETFVRQMQDTLCDIAGVRRTKVQRQGSLCCVAWGYHPDLKTIYRLLYPEGDNYIFLRRKRRVFRKVVRQTVARKGPTVQSGDSVSASLN